MRKTNLQTPQLNLSDFQDKSLLILDDDDPLRGRLSRAMEKKGFLVREAKTVLEGLEMVKKSPPNFAVIDLRLEDGNGLDVIKELSKSKSDCRIVMLTGYGNLPTAVAAVKAGAIDYIAKPVDADDVESALLAAPESKAKPPENPMSADRVKWEHIHRVFELCNRNVSETARRLKMHRRTLQRILSKRSPRKVYIHFLKMDNLSLNSVTIIESKDILKSSASKNGLTPKSIMGLSQPIKVPSHITPKK